MSQFDKTWNAKIYIGFNEEEKADIMKSYASWHYQTLYIHNDDLFPNRIAKELPNVRIENHYNCTDLDKETQLREKAFNKCCLIIDEVLNPNHSYEVVFNRMSYYVKSCDECLIFQYVPCIESINDFLLFMIQEHTKFGKKSKNIERVLTQDMIDELVSNVEVIVKKDTEYKAIFEDVILDSKDISDYTDERNKLFAELKPNQDAVKVYNNLNKFVAKQKYNKLQKRALWRAKTGGKTIYGDRTETILPVCEFPLKQKAVADYMCLNDTKTITFWISNTKVDQYNKKVYGEMFDDCNELVRMIQSAKNKTNNLQA